MKRQFYQFLVRMGANACGIFLASQLLNGVSYQEHFVALLVTATILSIVNVVIKPIVVILALPAYAQTLGLFSIIVNALMLHLVDVLYGPFSIVGIFASILAGTIIGLVNYMLTRVFDSVSDE